MKSLVAAGIAVLVLASAAAAQTGHDYLWDGGSDDRFDKTKNWDQTGMSPKWPGSRNGVEDDTGYIGNSTNSNPVKLSHELDEEFDWLHLDAGTASAAVSMELLTGGTMEIDEYMRLTAGDSDNETATFKYTDGTLHTMLPQFDMDGGSAALREAVLDIDASLNLSASTDIDCSGYCKVEVASNFLFEAKEVYLVAGSNMTVSDGGTLQATTLTVNNATLQVTDATIQTADPE